MGKSYPLQLPVVHFFKRNKLLKENELVDIEAEKRKSTVTIFHFFHFGSFYSKFASFKTKKSSPAVWKKKKNLKPQREYFGKESHINLDFSRNCLRNFFESPVPFLITKDEVLKVLKVNGKFESKFTFEEKKTRAVLSALCLGNSRVQNVFNFL